MLRSGAETGWVGTGKGDRFSDKAGIMGGIKDGVRLKNEFGDGWSWKWCGNGDGAEVRAEVRNGNRGRDGLGVAGVGGLRLGMKLWMSVKMSLKLGMGMGLWLETQALPTDLAGVLAPFPHAGTHHGVCDVAGVGVLTLLVLNDGDVGASQGVRQAYCGNSVRGCGNELPATLLMQCLL